MPIPGISLDVFAMKNDFCFIDESHFHLPSRANGFSGKARLKERSTRRELESAGALGNMFSVHIIIIVFLVSDVWPVSCIACSPHGQPPHFKICGVAIP